jgi:GNAT superfamily N-acetyltransferase
MEDRISPPSSLHRLTLSDIEHQLATQSIILIRDKSDPIACLFVTQKPDLLYLGKIAVHPDHRRKGALAAMLAVAEDLAKNWSLTRLQLETRIELSENHATFARLGFVQTAQTAHPGFAQPTSITMEKLL